MEQQTLEGKALTQLIKFLICTMQATAAQPLYFSPNPLTRIASCWASQAPLVQIRELIKIVWNTINLVLLGRFGDQEIEPNERFGYLGGQKLWYVWDASSKGGHRAGNNEDHDSGI